MHKINNNYKIQIKNSDSWRKETTTNMNKESFELRTSEEKNLILCSSN